MVGKRASETKPEGEIEIRMAALSITNIFVYASPMIIHTLSYQHHHSPRMTPELQAHTHLKAQLPLHTVHPLMIDVIRRDGRGDWKAVVGNGGGVCSGCVS